MSPFLQQLNNAADRLDRFARRSALSLRQVIHKEAVAVREAVDMLEGTPCQECDGKGELRETGPGRIRLVSCDVCGGSGDL